MTEAAADEAAVTAQPANRPVMFTGGRGELARIALVNTLLTAVTLSIYRFWAKTRIRQYYWRHIEIDGDALEYTGRAIELFLGFLIAIAVLIPVFMAAGAVQLFVSTQNQQLGALLELGTYVILFWLFGYAAFRARRYRLTCTQWRGIRFGQAGSPARYAFLVFGTTLAAVFSLGLAVPWVHVAVRRYEMANTRFGFTRFDYHGKGRDLLAPWVPVLILFWSGCAVLGFVLLSQADTIMALFALAAENGGEIGTDDTRSAAHFQALFGAVRQNAVWLALPWLALIPFLARYRVATLRYLFAVSELKGVRCRSGIRTRRVIVYVFAALAISILAVVLAAVLVFVGAFIGVLLAILVLLSLNVIRQIFLTLPVVRYVIATLEVSGLSALGDVVQGTRDDPRFGEGLLDALDVDVGAF